MYINSKVRLCVGVILALISWFATPENKWVDFVVIVAAIGCFMPEIRKDLMSIRKKLTS